MLESIVTKTRDRKAALKLLKKPIERHGRPETIVTDPLRSYGGAALKDLGCGDEREMGHWLNNTAESSHHPFPRRERAMLWLPCMQTLEKFALVHALAHNHFPTGRHPHHRNFYTTTRAAAFIEWRGLLAAWSKGWGCSDGAWFAFF